MVVLSRAGLGKRSYPVYMASVGASGAGVPSVPVLACGGGRADMADTETLRRKGKVALTRELATANERRVWTGAACVVRGEGVQGVHGQGSAGGKNEESVGETIVMAVTW